MSQSRFTRSQARAAGTVARASIRVDRTCDACRSDDEMKLQRVANPAGTGNHRFGQLAVLPQSSPAPGGQTVEVSEPSDASEREADEMAARALASSDGDAPLAPSRGSGPQLARAVGEAAAAGGFIVDDDAATLLAGQMRKTDFLRALHAEACTSANRELARVGRSTDDCPYLDRWFVYYEKRDAAQVERALRKYAPETAQASSASGYLPSFSARVAQAARKWATTGTVTDLPDGLSPGEPGGVLGAVGGALSAIGSLFTKADAGGARRGVDRAALDARLGAGRPLDGGAQSRMGAAFGYDFARVRVHADREAGAAVRELNALAFTIGHHVAFAPGRYRPGDPVGDALLAHELAHVVQQGQALPQSPSSTDERPIEHDADAAAEHAVRSLWAPDSRTDKRPRQPQLRSGVQLRRCTPTSGKDEGDTGVTEQKSDKPAPTVTPPTKQPDAGPPPPPPVVVPPCTTKFTKATNFQQMIDLVKAAEIRLAAAGITAPQDQIHALRGIYYGTPWSMDFLKEKSTLRNEGFQLFTRPSASDPNKTVPPDVTKILDCGIVDALKASQDLTDPSGRQVDFGHLIIALDARFDPDVNKRLSYHMLDVGGTGTEAVTWLGDLGGGAAALALRRVPDPTKTATDVFTGTDYGGSINLEGDVAGSVVATTGTPTAVAAPVIASGKGLSDILNDYLAPAGAGPAWNQRAKTFLSIIGGTFDPTTGNLNNRAALVTWMAPKLESFACNYLASRVKDKKISFADAKAAADKYVVNAASDVASVFVDALAASVKTGAKIEATGAPKSSGAGASSCGALITAAGFLGGLGGLLGGDDDKKNK